MRVIDNLQGRSPAIGIDATGRLKARASVAGGGSTAPGTLYILRMDDYGYTATTPVLSTGAGPGSHFLIGIAEGTITSGLSTASPGAITDKYMYDFVVGGPTILQSTMAAGTTGQGMKLTTGLAVPAVTGAAYIGGPGEFGVFRRAYDSTAGAYSTGSALSTAVTVFGALSTGTQYIYLVPFVTYLTS